MTCSNAGTQPPRLRAGFTLLEVLIAVAIMGLLAYLVASRLNAQRYETARADMITAYSNEYRTIARALREHVAANVSSWAVNTPTTITVANLITAGRLPAGYTARAGVAGTGTTPIGTSYAMRAMRVASGPPLTVLYETGSEPNLRLFALGDTLSAGQVAMDSVRTDVAATLRGAGLITGVISPSTTVLQGGASNQWTKDLVAVIGAAPGARPSLAAVSGYPDLEPEGIGTGTNPLGSSNTCRVVYPNCPSQTNAVCAPPNTMTSATCPSGYTEKGRFPSCLPPSGVGVDTFYPVADGSAVITLGASFTDERQFTNDECTDFANQGGSQGSILLAACRDARHRTMATTINLNNAVQNVRLCDYSGATLTFLGTASTVNPFAFSQPRTPPVAEGIFCCR